MGRVKIEYSEEKDIVYSLDHWALLRSIRQRAQIITDLFYQHGIDTLTYGSVARGDVKPTSDIDIILCQQIPSYRIELILEEAKISIIHKKIVQATPNDVIKAHFELSDEICISLLLTDFTSMPFEFYRFGGAVSHQQLCNNERVPGVDKRLVLILPTSTGHHEQSIIDHTYEVAKVIGISPKMVEQRIRVLTRRDKVGRTGVFLNVDLDPSQNVEEELATLARSNSMIRRRLNFN